MNNINYQRLGLSLEPFDTLFFRDGRPFDAATRIASGLPAPQTVTGALRTWLLRQAGCGFERLAEALKKGASFADAAADGQPDDVAAIARLQFRGPWFALKGEPLVPVPATLKRVKETGEIVRLDPLKSPELPGWVPPEPEMLPLWLRDTRTVEPLEGYLTLPGLKRFLDGGVPAQDDIQPDRRLFDFDRRTGIAVNPATLTAEEGMIYGVGLLALAKDVTLYAEVIETESALQLIPADWAPLPLGGEGRRVALRTLDQPVTWPRAQPQAGSGSLLLLTSPAPFAAPEWRPAHLSPLAAAVPGHVAVSGWDMARGGPKPNRFAAAAGSVYFLKQPLRPPAASLCDGEDAAVGWGTFVEGVWNYV